MLRYPILAILFPVSLYDCPSNLMYALGYLSSNQPLLLAIAFTLLQVRFFTLVTILVFSHKNIGLLLTSVFTLFFVNTISFCFL